MSEKTLKSFFQNLRFSTLQGQELWDLMKVLPDSFDSDFDLVARVKQAKGLELPTLGKQGIPYLPIEYFRERQIHQLFLQNSNKKPAKVFKSSGTTSATAAQSLFSTDGLLLYMGQSLKVFNDVLKRFYQRHSTAIPGISLVPHISDRPDSSLSQMISWIGDFWHVDFVRPEKLSEFLESSKVDQALWVFGTAFDFINVFDRGVRRKLPEGSVVFETGGYKGKSRELTRDALFKLISDLFFLPTEKIVSEYGMCEFACQAYDFSFSPDRPRTFRFPAWVNRLVHQGPQTASGKGEGALVTYDPLRIDFPWPIRTQDIVDMKADSTFTYMGRVPQAPLKGCSLDAEEGHREKKTLFPPRPLAPASSPSLTLKMNPKLMNEFLSKFLNDASTLKSLEDEFKSTSAARSALKDLSLSIPQNDEAWKQASTNSSANAGDSWLIIAPNNHSLASIYPVVIGSMAGLELSVRLPRNFERPDSCLNLFLQGLGKLSPISILPSSVRVPEGPFPEKISHILVFGDNQTIQDLEKKSQIPIKGFGTGITASLLTSCSPSDADLLAKDMLSLGQRGCFSSRALFCFASGKGLLDFLQVLRDECRRFWNAPLSTFERIAVDLEAVRFRNLGTSFVVPRDSNDDCFLPIIEITETRKVWELLSPHPFVLPVFYYRDENKLLSDLTKFPNLICLSVSNETLEQEIGKDLLKTFPVVPLGSANAPVWDGLHNGVPLF
ncbi:MAG: hypothetical protein HYW48_08700 [Deltaproteobacteria bacterium]|nr:hypothetical protein [Deltaproteobacteria bacterium]